MNMIHRQDLHDSEAKNNTPSVRAEFMREDTSSQQQTRDEPRIVRTFWPSYISFFPVAMRIAHLDQEPISQTSL
ncbi:hypothetical protein E1B28_012314 [Marasmius oreades]|uniref:Uncharacterized protein n=1 Tax=Marasmius oreades TaxID=181124 RepID=A0A9P7RRB0_9AGAR|nr:uncharacterized protein E1B28_012314 [Marasmius oreades]KAG7088304.1 hypothetical protein E1B28_012314 [Marasmius oreades]